MRWLLSLSLLLEPSSKKGGSNKRRPQGSNSIGGAKRIQNRKLPIQWEVHSASNESESEEEEATTSAIPRNQPITHTICLGPLRSCTNDVEMIISPECR